jgi:hypothetical protein
MVFGGDFLHCENQKNIKKTRKCFFVKSGKLQKIGEKVMWPMSRPNLNIVVT